MGVPLANGTVNAKQFARIDSSFKRRKPRPALERYMDGVPNPPKEESCYI